MAPEPPRLRDRPAVLAAVWTLSFFASAYEIVPASIAPPLQTQLGVDATAVGWLVGVMFAVPIVWSLPVGWLLGRVSLRDALVAAGLILGIAGVAGWHYTRRGAYLPLLATRALGGMGFVLMWNSALETYGRFRNRATATGLFIASSPIGFALGHVTGPVLAEAVGVGVPFLAYSLLLALPIAGLLVTGHRIPRVADDGAETPSAEMFAALAGNRALATVCVLGFVSYSLYLFVNSWMPSYLNTHLGFSLTRSGLLIALFPLVGALSRTAGGVVADRAFDGRRRPVVLITFVATALLVGALSISRGIAVVTLALLGSGFFVQLSLGLFYSYVPELLPADRVSGGIAVLTTVSMTGAFSAPVVAAWLLERFGSYAVPFGYAVGLAIVGVVVAWAFAEPGGRERERAR
ncbi:MAG: nitrate/nitrite transporter [Haloquadratum sp.]